MADTNVESCETIDSLSLIQNLSFCVFDLETTGGNHNIDRIIEIGLVRIENLKIVSSKNILINPQIPIPEFIQKLTSIKEKDVEKAPIIENVIDDILNFMGDSVLVAHNISFDIPFFNSVLVRLKKEKLKNKVICTNIMSKHLIPEIMNSNLNYMSGLFDIEHGQAHRAMEDAKATAELFITFLKFFIEKKVKKVNHLYYPRNKYELDRIHFESKKDLPEMITTLKKMTSPGFVTLKGPQGILLTVIPIHNIKDDFEFVKAHLENLSWTQATVRLISPFVEVLFAINMHIDKLPPDNREVVLNYLTRKFKKAQDFELEKFDFLVSRHLIPEQMSVYSLLNFQPKGHMVFRYPAQKKKLSQFFNSHMGRFESSRKIRRLIIHPDLHEHMINFLASTFETDKANYLFIENNALEKAPRKTSKKIEEFCELIPNPYNFPKIHL